MKIKIILLIFFTCLLFSQEEQPYPPLDLITIPTSGTLPKGTYALETLLTKNGGILPKFLLGVSDHFTFGISFGVQKFIGTGDFIKNKSYPEVHIKYRLYEETESMPAIAIGLNTQGYGKYNEAKERYEHKALGVYFVASRNWDVLGNLGFHIGINKNLIEKHDKDTNLFFGFDKEINRTFSILAEYNFAMNDDGKEDSEILLRDKKGFLNAGIRWTAIDNLMLEINVNDILKNNLSGFDGGSINSMNREIKIIYFEQF